MKKHQINNELRNAVLERIKIDGAITTEEVMELMRPYAGIEPEKAAEQALRKKANKYMSGFRDADGVRTCFTYTDEAGYRQNVHIEYTNDLNALKAIDEQLNRRLVGLSNSQKKVARRMAVMEGQLALPGFEGLAASEMH